MHHVKYYVLLFLQLSLCRKIESCCPRLVYKGSSSLRTLARKAASFGEYLLSSNSLSTEYYPFSTTFRLFQKVEKENKNPLVHLWQSKKADFALAAIGNHLERPQRQGHKFCLSTLVDSTGNGKISEVVTKQFNKCDVSDSRIFALTQVANASSQAPEYVIPVEVIRNVMNDLIGMKQDQQEDTAALIETICSKSCEMNFPRVVGETVKLYLIDQKAKVPRWGQRFALIGVLQSCFHGLRKNRHANIADDSSFFEELLNHLASYIATESNSDTIRAAARALGKGVCILKRIPSKVHSWMQKCLENVELGTREQNNSVEQIQLLGASEAIRLMSEVPEMCSSIKDEYLSLLRRQMENILEFDASDASFRYQGNIDVSIQCLGAICNLSSQSEGAAKFVSQGSSTISKKQNPVTIASTEKAGKPSGPKSLGGKGKTGKGMPAALQLAAKSQTAKGSKSKASGSDSKTSKSDAAGSGINLPSLMANSKCALFSPVMFTVDEQGVDTLSRVAAISTIISTGLQLARTQKNQTGKSCQLLDQSRLLKLEADLDGRNCSDGRSLYSISGVQDLVNPPEEKSKADSKQTSKDDLTVRYDHETVTCKGNLVEEDSPVFVTLVHLVCHPNWVVRKISVRNLQGLLSNAPSISLCLLHAMARVLFAASDQRFREEVDKIKSITGNSYALLPSHSIISPSSELDVDVRDMQYKVLTSGKYSDIRTSVDTRDDDGKIGKHLLRYGDVEREDFMSGVNFLLGGLGNRNIRVQKKELLQRSPPLRFMNSCQWDACGFFCGKDGRYMLSSSSTAFMEHPDPAVILPILALIVHHPFVSQSHKAAWKHWEDVYVSLCKANNLPCSLEPTSQLVSALSENKETLQLSKSMPTKSASTASRSITASALDKFLQQPSTVSSMTSWLLSTSGMLSPNKIFRTMSQRLVTSLAAGVLPMSKEKHSSSGQMTGVGARHVVYCKLVPELLSQIDSLLCNEMTKVEAAAHSVFKNRKLTDDISAPSIPCGLGGTSLNQVAIWQAPQGQLVDVASSSKRIEYRQSRNVRRDRTGKKRAQRMGVSHMDGDDQDDEEFLKSLYKSSTEQATDESKKKMMKFQENVRTQLQVIQDLIAYILRTIDHMVLHEPSTTRSLFDVFFPRLCHLMQSPLCSQFARHTMKTMYEVMCKLDGDRIASLSAVENSTTYVTALQKLSEYNLFRRCQQIVQRIKQLREEALQSVGHNSEQKSKSNTVGDRIQDKYCLFSVFPPSSAEDIRDILEKAIRINRVTSENLSASKIVFFAPIVLAYLASYPLAELKDNAYAHLANMVKSTSVLRPSVQLGCGGSQNCHETQSLSIGSTFDVVWTSNIGDLEDIINCQMGGNICMGLVNIQKSCRKVASNEMKIEEAEIDEMKSFFSFMTVRPKLFEVLYRLAEQKLVLTPSPSELMGWLSRSGSEVTTAQNGVILPAELHAFLMKIESLAEHSDVRTAVHESLEKCYIAYGPDVEKFTRIADPTLLDENLLETWEASILIVVRLNMSCFDPDESLRARANNFCTNHSLLIPPGSWLILRNYLGSYSQSAQNLVGDSVAALLNQHQSQFEPVVQDLMDMFQTGEQDDSGDLTYHRSSILSCFSSLCEKDALRGDKLSTVLKFLVQHGLADLNFDVRLKALDTCLSLVDIYGVSHSSEILKFVEDFMSQGQNSGIAATNDDSFDFQREGTVLLLGAVAKHLDDNNSKVLYAIHTLIDAARNTPSEPVQRSVAKCLPPLVKKQKEQMNSTFSDILAVVTTAETYGERRGAAYALAGCVKGCGISVLRSLDIISSLESAAQDRNAHTREGAILAFECLFDTLKMLFEPYIVRVVPLLLKAYSDDKEHVREVAEEAAKVIMGNLTNHGVKLVLPSLLKGTQDVEWRSKRASLSLLGNMAYCAPKQLSKALPQIVPRLIESFTDTHPKVQSACRGALNDIGKVIQNPEISQLVPKLINALANPSEATNDCLDSLSHSAFSHAIDPASLALVMPVIRRGLRERSASTKRTACVLVSNISSLVSDAEDIVPYLSLIIPVLKKVCIDPIPDVRHSAANALGALASGIEYDTLEEHNISGWLWETMKNSSSVAERSGAAQASCAYYWAQASDVFEKWLNDILELNTSDSPLLKEGYFWTLAALPSTLKGHFSKYIEYVLPNVVSGLSDDHENIREVAFQAGKMIIERHGATDTDKLLPTLKRSLFDTNWRIRESSVTLLSLLLQILGGVKSTASLGSLTANLNSTIDQGYRPEVTKSFGDSDSFLATVASRLGENALADCLSCIFLVRFDLSNVVRQVAVKEWKDLVNHPPKTLRDILQSLTQNILRLLCAEEEDHRIIASKCLGDLMKKIGEHVLKEIVPLLKRGLESGDMKTVQGVCFGISELVHASTRRSVEEYFASLIPHIQRALSSNDYEVQEAAAEAFSALHERLGEQIVHSTIPTLLEEINDADSEKSSRALRGLKEMMSQDKKMIDYLVPKLTVAPLSEYQLKALAAISEISGNVLKEHFRIVLPAIIKTLAIEDREAADDDIDEMLNSKLANHATTTLLSVSAENVHQLLAELLRNMESESNQRRWVCLWLIGQFCNGKDVSYYEDQLPLLLKTLLYLLSDRTHEKTMQAAWNTLNQLGTAAGPDILINHLRFINDCISSAVSEAKNRAGFLVSDTRNAQGDFEMPGFSLKKGIEPLLPLYQKALLHGDSQTRELAARGLGIIVACTNAEALKPYFIKLTGPLIRTVGDKFPAAVKEEILYALTLIMGKGGASLKPFLPQLQTTFVRTLNDANKAVRTLSADALGQLMHLAPRVDPLINELCNNVGSAVGGIKDTMLEALFKVIRTAGNKISESFKRKATDLLLQLFEDDDDLTRTWVGMSLGAMLGFVEKDTEISKSILESVLRKGSSSNYLHTQIHCIRMSFKYGKAEHLVYLLKNDAIGRLQEGISSGSYLVQEACAAAVGVVLSCAECSNENAELLNAILENQEEFVDVLVKALRSGVKRVRRLALLSIARASKHSDILRSQKYLVTFLPALAKGLQDTNSGVKNGAEYCATVYAHVGNDSKFQRLIATYEKSGSYDEGVVSVLSQFARRRHKQYVGEEQAEDSDTEFL